MSAQRTRVYVAYEPFIGDIPGHSGNIRTQRLVVESHPAIALYPLRWTFLGDVDATTAAQIEMLGDEATLPKFVDRIAPIGIEPEDAPIQDGPIPDRGVDLKRNEILKARRDWQRDGPPQSWIRAGATKSTYIRYRHKHGLVPWPDGYLRRLTP